MVRRPFMMARSGASGIQRFGTSMWSADIGSNLENLAAHMNAQLHMSLSRLDYFGSDIGGFHRGALNGEDLSMVYTQWFADGLLTDIPARPHANNSSCPYGQGQPSGNCHETAPDRVGDRASNLANLRQRYAMSPYLYSLAHRAYLAGEPVVPPLVYYYQTDPNVRRLGSEKLLGRDLLVALVADRNGPQTRDVYLPAGDWVDYRTNEWLHSTGETFAGRPLMHNGVFSLPVFARAGALIPKMYVDKKTMNIFGKRSDGSTRDELILRAYAAPLPSGFTLYEDDGQTQAYLGGAVRTTRLSQQLAADGSSAAVTIAAAEGNYQGAPAARGAVVELVTHGQQATGVSLNGSPLPALATPAALDTAASGWVNAGGNLILAKSESGPVTAARTFVFALKPAPEEVTAAFQCRNGTTVWRQSVYVAGAGDRLGNWDPSKAVKLSPTTYPRWTGTLDNLPARKQLAWKCLKRPEGAAQPVVWQAGNNNVLVTPAGGAVTTSGNFQP
ncbi:carbohydrate-binding module family 20 domain-containing protein [uncultured Thiodictyon sp.]|uniref:carbohydrate-binding module family 20 domain-containing protein n=1 Tax=uncultured Thiodictyon sp. TaxID=1846217 RepID=UPI0025F3F65C|nr:carbohydrate-binding module family 20 domain-containing protein [uncultured Thiodictyon sp.]